MMISKVSTNFYRLDDVFSDELLTEIDSKFANVIDWQTREGAFGIRRESCIESPKLNEEITPIVNFIEQVIDKKVYSNGSVLWYDYLGYQNGMHTDLSPNLAVNLQVYLNDGSDNMGTSCFDEEWHSVPFKKNCGYVLIGPTKIKHGMRYAAEEDRLSLYQSFRDTLKESNIW